MASLLTANTNDASNIVRPTEAQLRWAQFHYKRRAQGVKLSINRLYQTPKAVQDVVGALPEDGDSTSSISEAEAGKPRPKVSKGRRAYLRVSRRRYVQRAREIQNKGFRRLQGTETFSDGEDDELNDIFMTKRRRQRRRHGEDIERLKRFEDACHAMMMNIAQPEQQVIVIPAKRWTRTADHIAASAMLDEEYLDPKWGIRRRTLAASKVGGENQFNLQHRAMSPVDRGASWLMHLPEAIPSSRDNPSANFYINKHSTLATGTVVSEGISDGGETVSTLAMKAPGEQKFNQLVALAQRQLIDQQINHSRHHTGPDTKIVQQEDSKNPEWQENANESKREPSFQSKPTKSYMPRMRLRDFVLDSGKVEGGAAENELSPEEMLVLNQIPTERYLEALRRIKGSERRPTGRPSYPRSQHTTSSTNASLATYHDTAVTISKSKLQPEELAVMESIVGSRLRDLDIEPYETRRRYLDVADKIVQEVEAAEGEAQNNRLRNLFDSVIQSSNPSQKDVLVIEKAMALQQIIKSRTNVADANDVNETSWTRYSRALRLAAAFESNSIRFGGVSRGPAAKGEKFRNAQLDGEADIQAEELFVMMQGISLYLERELQGKNKEAMKKSFYRTAEMPTGLAGRGGRETTRIIRQMYDLFEQQADGLSRNEQVQPDEVFLLHSMIRSRFHEIENGGSENEKQRLTRAKLIGRIFEADGHQGQSERVKEMVYALEAGNSQIHFARNAANPPSTSGTSFDSRRLSEPLDAAPTYPERQPRHSEPTRLLHSGDQRQQTPALDTTFKGLWNRGKQSFDSISGAFKTEAASFALPQQARDAGISVSDKTSGLFRNSEREHNQPQRPGHQFSAPHGSLSSVSERVDLYLDSLKALQDSEAANRTEQASMQPETVEGQVDRLGRNFDAQQSTFQESNEKSHRLGGCTINERLQPSHSMGDRYMAPRHRYDDDFDESDLQPQPPHRTRVEQEILEAMTSSLPKQDAVKEYAPDDFDVDYLAAYRKKRESTTLTDDVSSASSYKVLPSGFRDVVKHYTPSRNSNGFSISPEKNHKSGDSEEPEEIPKLSEENISKLGRNSAPVDAYDVAVFDSDELPRHAGRHIDPSVLSSLMLSPDLLTKRHQQAVRAIECSEWDDVNYLIHANPWLAEMSELTTKQYLLHKIAFFGAGHAPAPVELCQLLLDKFPAAVHKFDEDGNVPLHLAAAAGHMKMITILGEKFESGASIRNEDGMLPLHFALASYGRLGFAATPHANSQTGESTEPIEVLKKVLSFFPQAVAISDSDGNLPLHVAVHCLEGEVAIDAIALLLSEAQKQLNDPNGARFRNKVKFEEILEDGLPKAFTSDDELDIETEVHCTMVRNNEDECPLTLAIHTRKGWQIIDALVASPGGKEAALYQDSNDCTALHLLVGEFQDPAAALSVLKSVPETTTVRNNEGMLPIEVACMQLMPDEVILAIALADLHLDLNGGDLSRNKENFGGSWWFLTCECDDHYVDIVRSLVSMCSFDQVRMLCIMEGGPSQNRGTVFARATPKCREVLTQAIRFLGRFEFIGKKPLYSDVDRQIKAFDAFDFGGGSRASDEGRRVVLKSYSLMDVFLAETENLRAYVLDESKVEEVLTFYVGEGGEEHSWVSIERPEATLKDVADSMMRKGGYWNQPELRSKYATKVCLVLRLVAKSLRHLHSSGVIHGDLSLQSCGKYEREWKLLGRMEVQPLGKTFDTSRFQHSFPPESLHSSELDINAYDTDAPPVAFKQTIISDPSIDIWAFGKLAYEAILGKPLVAYDANLPANDVVALLEVMEWNEDCLKDVFHELLESGGIAESGAELFTSCLFPQPEDRPKSMDEILSHQFWHENIKQRDKSRGSRRRRNTDSISAFTEASKSLFTELSD